MKWRSLQEAEPGLDKRPLREQYAERKELIAKYVPQEVQAINVRCIRELSEGRILDGVLASGTSVPSFELHDQRGNAVALKELLGRGRVVILFFRGRWCPFCVGQLEAMNRVLPQIHQAGATLLAISPQTVKQNFFMADQHRLEFPLLSDPVNAVAHKFGVAYQVPEYQRETFRRSFINLPLANGDNSWKLPIPSTFIVAGEGAVTYASANPDYTERPEPAAILAPLLR